jgi:phosphoribosyl-dephospho-CoA transferase
MTTKPDFQKPMEAVQTLMAIQAQTIAKSIELQKKSGEELMAFFQSEAQKAASLKTPEELIRFNVEANTALFKLLQAQGQTFTAFATEAGQAAMASFKGMGK